MVWTYHQANGRLEQNGKPVAIGYSGAGKGVNDPAMQNVGFVGPIPRGKYAIGSPYDTKANGPHVMALTPLGHKALGRTDFLIHGDNKSQTASQGCIILAADIRRKISTSGDAVLEVVEGPTNLSGMAWWHANQANYANSSAIGDLAPGFRQNVEKFITALERAGAVVRPSATLRNRIRAHLMHYSYRLAKGKIKAAHIPAVKGCDIDWDHGIEVKSRRAAQEMVDLFDIVYQPSLTSLHIQGKAIDMSISWAGTITIRDGKRRDVELGGPQNGARNTVLHRIGASYGVHKLLSDAPHWSVNGH